MDIMDILDIQDPNLPYYILISAIVIGLGQLFENLYWRAQRTKAAIHEREVYHQKLEHDSLVIEKKKLEEELQSKDTIENILKEGEDLAEQLEDNEELSDSMFERKLELLNAQLKELKNKSNEFNDIKEEIVVEKEKLLDCLEQTDQQNINKLELENLITDIKLLDDENQNLEAQVRGHKALAPSYIVDSEVSQFVDKHKDELSLDFLEKANETLLELKATNSPEDFDKYINEMKSRQDRAKELAELRLENKQAEIKLNLIKKRYQEELTSFDDLRVEHLFKICGARQLKDALDCKSDIQEELKVDLEKDFETKKGERMVLHDKLREAEKQRNQYWQAWKDTEMKRVQKEAEIKASLERERSFAIDPLNFSSRSSISNESQIPPPPDIAVPTVDEILRLTANHSVNSHYTNFDRNQSSSIPTPPPIDVPLDGTFNNHSINTRSIRSTSSTGGDINSTRVGSSYGMIFNSRSGNFGQ